MTPFLQLIFLLALLLLAAKTVGFISIRLGQPSVLGELLMGVLLGPSLLNLLGLPMIDTARMTEILHLFGEIGVLLLMFIAGLELDIHELTHTGRVAVLAGTLGVLVPVLFGAAVGLAFQIIEATERVVGSLEQPGSGILAVLPVNQVRGLHKRKANDG